MRANCNLIDPNDFNPEQIQIQIDSGILPNFDIPQVEAPGEGTDTITDFQIGSDVSVWQMG